MTQDIDSAETTVARALEANPALGARLRALHTACVGCCLARFCTLRDASNYYKIPLDLFIEELRSATSNISVPKE
jgi:hypothetical protein